MKLIKCYVSSFGKLKDFSYDFSSGINTIKEHNGWGKSTLATFIKTMFYGLNGTSKRSVADNERIKFRPWNSTETFGGYVEFEKGGKRYKIERYFGAKDNDDTVTLTDLETGKIYPGETGLGKRIFEIDEEGFLSTTFFSQKDFQIKSNTSITAKYNSVCEVQDSQAFDNALKKIEEKAKTYKYRGDKGLISDTKREINYISEEIESIFHSLDAVKNLKSNIDRLQTEVSSLKALSDELTKKVSLAGEQKVVALKKERYNELCKEYKELLARRQDLESALNSINPSEQEIALYLGCVREIDAICSAEKLLEAEIDNLRTQIIDKQAQNPKKKINVFLLVAIALLAVGAGLLFLNEIVGVVVMVLGVASLVVSFLKGVRKTNDEKTDVYREMLIAKEKQLTDYLVKKAEYQKKLDNFFENVSFEGEYDNGQKLTFINNALSARKDVDDKIKNTLETLESLKPSVLKLEENVAVVDDLETLKMKMSSVQREYAQKANELADKKASVKRYEEYSDKLADLESKRAEKLENIQKYKEDYDVLCLTADYLKKADENLKVKYRAPLQESLNKYLKLIDESKDAQIDIDLNLTAIEKGGEKSTEYYSKGYQNLFEICKRFALIDVLFAGEKPFIILDDPFYNLDDEKLLKSLDLIKKLSDEYQILYFICHESRRA